MEGNAGDGEVVDGKHVASKAGDVGDNGWMTCGVEVSGVGMEHSGGIKVSGGGGGGGGGGVEYSSGMKVSGGMEVS